MFASRIFFLFSLQPGTLAAFETLIQRLAFGIFPCPLYLWWFPLSATPFFCLFSSPFASFRFLYFYNVFFSFAAATTFHERLLVVESEIPFPLPNFFFWRLFPSFFPGMPSSFWFILSVPFAEIVLLRSL